MSCGNDCNEYIFWIGANEAASIQALHQFVFHEISKYVNVQQSGVKQHPFTFQRTGNKYCLTALHHLLVKDYGEQHKSNYINNMSNE